jgi:HK97 family phage major capsid protein
MTDEVLTEAPPAKLDVPVCRDFNVAQEFRAAAPAGDGTETLDAGDVSPGTMYGHFATFNQWYRIRSFWEGDFLERIAPGSFKRTINNRSDMSPVRVLLDHGYDPQLGDKPIGIPSVLEEKAAGPYGEVPLFAGVPQMIVEGLRAGAYGQSFAFNVLQDRWVEDPEASGWEDPGRSDWADLPQRTIEEVRLHEFGPTPFPANPGADAGLRSATDHFYERMRRRDPDTVEQYMARAVMLRTGERLVKPTVIDLKTKPVDTPDKPPAAKRTIPVPSKVQTEDSPKSHSVDSPPKALPDSRTKRHSEASPKTTSRKEGIPVMADDDLMTATERSARQSEISARLTEIDNEHNGAELPEELQTEWDSLSSEFDRHAAAIEADTKRKARIADLAKRQEGERAESARSAPAVHRRPDNIYDLAGIRQAARSIDEMPHLLKENALRSIDEARFHFTGDLAKRGQSQESAKENLRNLLEFVDDENGKLARRLLVTGSPLYARAFGKFIAAQSTMGLSTEEQRALAVGAASTGGFAVPYQLDPTLILTSAAAINPFRRIARIEQITGKEWDGLTTAGITVSRAAEAAQASDNAPTLAQPVVKAERVQGFVPFSIEADQDWARLQTEMTRLLNEAKDVEEASSFLLGNGVSPNANGLLDPTAGITGASDVVANTITAAAVYGLENALPVRYRANARFMAAKAIYNAIRQLDTQGGAQMWERIGAGQPAQLLGYPAEENSNMPSNPTPALNDRWMVLGDFSQFLIVDRMGMEVDLIPHLFGANFRPTGQRGIYALWRNNSKVLNVDAFRVAKRTT